MKIAVSASVGKVSLEKERTKDQLIRGLGAVPLQQSKTPGAKYGCDNCRFFQYTPAFHLSHEYGPKLTEVISQETGQAYRSQCHFVPPDIPRGYTGKVLLVGEAPGAEEDSAGMPFLGRSGKLLRNSLERAGIDRRDYAIANVVACRPPNNKNPTFAEALPCSGNLGALIQKLKPRVIVALGTPALAALTGDKDAGITKVVSQPSCESQPRRMTIAGHMTYLVAQFHPAFILRNDHLSGHYGIAFNKLAEFLDGLDGKKTLAGPKAGDWKTITEFKAALSWLDKMEKSDGVISFDFETSSLDPYNGEILCAGLSNTPGIARAIPLHHPQTPFTPAQIQALERRLARLVSTKRLIGQNLKFDEKWSRVKWGATFNLYADTLLDSYIFDERSRIHALDAQISRLLPEMPRYWDEADRHLKEHGSFSTMDLNKLGFYCAGDCDATLQIHLKYETQFEGHDRLRRLARGFMPRVSRLLSRIESNGLFYDVEYGLELVDWLKKQMDNITHKLSLNPAVRKLEVLLTEERRDKRLAEINEFKRESARQKALAKLDEDTRVSFNHNSPPQVSRLLFEVLEYSPIKLTDSGAPSTDEETIHALYAQHKSPALMFLLALRKLDKANGTYAAPALLRATQQDGHYGFVHGSFHATGTVTGRLSSSDPNLQNIPATGLGLVVKRAYVSRFEGGFLMSWDLSQIELRLLAILSGDPDMIRVYRDGFMGGDLHLLTCCRIFDITAEQYYKLEKSEQKRRRTIAKRVNFGVAYGSEGASIVTALAEDGVFITEEQAHEYVELFFQRFPRVKAYIDRVRAKLHRDGYIEELFGRMRRLPEVYNSDYSTRSRAERQGVNAGIQGPASDINLTAAIIIQDWMDENELNSCMLGLIHDSILFDVCPGEEDALFDTCKTVLNAVHEYGSLVWGDDFDWSWATKVPITSECSVGWNWRDLVEEWEEEVKLTVGGKTVIEKKKVKLDSPNRIREALEKSREEELKNVLGEFDPNSVMV